MTLYFKPYVLQNVFRIPSHDIHINLQCYLSVKSNLWTCQAEWWVHKRLENGRIFKKSQPVNGSIYVSLQMVSVKVVTINEPQFIFLLNNRQNYCCKGNPSFCVIRALWCSTKHTLYDKMIFRELFNRKLHVLKHPRKHIVVVVIFVIIITDRLLA